MTQPPNMLVLNAGSSSIKFAVFDTSAIALVSGAADGIGAGGRVTIGADQRAVDLPDHKTALAQVLAALTKRGFPPQNFIAAAHRVVHGGADLVAPVQITAGTRAQIQDCIPLAPLHNPHNLAAIDELAKRVPGLTQFASFDTAFHTSNPAVATAYAVPDCVSDLGIRRYGFHGISYDALVRRWPEVTGTPLPPRVLALHLGNGASICAIKDGKSQATTMGYSPLEGLTMGTRAGGIDANAVLRLVDEFGAAETHFLLNSKSGLLGLSGVSADMRTLEICDVDNSAFAISHFCYWAVRHCGSLIAAMGGLDAIVFTGGIGENSAAIRARIVDGLGWLDARLDDRANTSRATQIHDDTSKIGLWIIPAAEEQQIALDALGLWERQQSNFED